MCNNINTNEQTSWKSIKKILSIKPQQTYPTLSHNNNHYTNNKDKANIFRHHLDETFNPNPELETLYNAPWKNITKSYPSILKTSNVEEIENEITMTEIGKYIDNLDIKKACGDDKITNKLIKFLRPSLVIILKDLFNMSFKYGYIPKNWKTAIVTMIPKPGKDKYEVKNYRPISLINCLGKLLEKIITDKLYSFVNTNNIINKEQSGFQKNKSTYDQLFQLTQSVSQNFNRKHRTAALFLDIDKAFDRVWHDGLRYKLIKANIPVNFIRWISNFIKDRKIQVKIENEKSEYLIPFNGVPQGSSLSPLLFLIYVADIPKAGKNVNTSQFADDIAIWTSITQPEKTNKNLQENLIKLKDWCNKWRIGLNAGKTKLLIFSNRKHNETLNLQVNGVKIIVIEYGEVKFLGVTLDSALTLKRHMEIIKAETAKQLNVLYKLKGVQYGPSTKTLINL